VDEPVGDGASGVVVADDQCGSASFAHELRDQRVDDLGVVGVELAGRRVGEQQSRPVHERGANAMSSGARMPGQRSDRPNVRYPKKPQPLWMP
jgi:hypothetical protein